AVPVRTLDLPVSAMVDGWGKRFFYAVTEKAATPGGFKNEIGGIYVRDVDGNEMTSTPGNVLYTIVSTGRDGKGGYTMQGVQGGGCTPGDADSENCDSDAVFINAEHSDGTIFYDDSMRYRSFID